MGRIKSIAVKSIGKDLIKQLPDTFSTDFDKNKAILSQIADFKYKKNRNAIAGLITNEIKKAEKATEYRRPLRRRSTRGTRKTSRW